jgi:hypothetical protein
MQNLQHQYVYPFRFGVPLFAVLHSHRYFWAFVEDKVPQLSRWGYPNVSLPITEWISMSNSSFAKSGNRRKGPKSIENRVARLDLSDV